MAAVAESKTERLTYKVYSTATYDSVVEAVMATDPAATGGQILRHVSHNLSLKRDVYRPNEKRQDIQRPMGAHGSATAPGTINGFMSPGTHADLFKYVLRSTWTASVALSEVELTSAAFDATASTVTYAAGDPVALGFKVGMILRHTNLAETANNSTNHVILGFGGTSNRTVTIYPAPTTSAADISFNVTSVGKDIIIPATGFTNYKVAFEVYNADTDLARFYSEARMGGFDLKAQVNQNIGLDFSLLARNRTTLSGGSAPFFTAPTAETTTDIPTAMQGLIRLNGATIGVATSLNMKCNLNPTAAKVKNTDGLVAGIFLEDAAIDGDFTSFLQDSTLLDAFDAETEMELLLYYPSNGTAAAPAQTFYLPRVKLNSADESEADGGKVVQCTFEAGRYSGSTAGVPSTTLQICDTEAA